MFLCYSTIYLLIPLIILSGLNTLNSRSTSNEFNLLNLPGKLPSSNSGFSESYHAFHSFPWTSKSWMIPLNSSPIVTNLYNYFNPFYVIQLYGFSVYTSSNEVFPFKKKSNYYLFNSSSFIFRVIWKLNINLCTSKIPKQV